MAEHRSNENEELSQSDEGEQPRGPARRGRRRASLPPVEGTDETPGAPTLTSRGEGENDDRLRADKPPHWG